MAKTDLDRAREIFLQARELPASERPAYLKVACEDDTELVLVIEELLAEDVAGTLGVPRALKEPEVPRQVGPYTILGVLGEGGMGIVYKGEQRKGIQRLVAIKVVKQGFNSKSIIARFESERQALAMMNHPNIAKVYEAGVTETAQPYFVMEYVEGLAITKFADKHKLTIRQRLRMFLQVCEAIGHAHKKLMIHRDIKASNVMAYIQDGRPAVKVIDFGIAKALTPDGPGLSTMHTMAGNIVGTYEAMSPEQAMGSDDIDTRTDVYSLGVLLYELLAGARPFDPLVIRKAAEHEIRRMISEEAPPKPSTRLAELGERATTVVEARQTEIRSLVRQLRSELEWIPLMAMRKERERRYSSPLQLADDIRNYLDHRPLIAGPESNLYRLRKFVTKRKVPVIATASAVVALMGGIIGTSIGFVGQRDLRVQSDHRAAEAVLARNAEAAAKQDAEKEQYLAETRLVGALRTQGEAEILSKDGLLAHHSFAEAGTEAHRFGISTEAIDMGQMECESKYPSPIASYPILSSSALDLSPDGRTMISLSPDKKSLCIRDIITGVQLGKLAENVEDIYFARYSPSGKLVLVVTPHEMAIWLASNAQLLQRFAVDGIKHAAFSPDEKTIAVTTNDSLVKVFEVATTKEVGAFASQPGWGSCITFTPDGKFLVGCGGLSVASSHKIYVWNAGTGQILHALEIPGSGDSAVSAEGLSADKSGDRVFACTWTGDVTAFNALNGKILAYTDLIGPGLRTSTLAVAPDGKLLLAAADNGTLSMVDPGSLHITATNAAHETGISRCGWLSAGGLNWSASRGDHSVKIWNPTEPPVMRSFCYDRIRYIDLSPDGSFLAIVRYTGLNGTDAAIEIMDCATGLPLLDVKEPAGELAVMPDGQHVVFLSSPERIEILDLSGREPIQTIRNDLGSWPRSLFTCVALSRDCKHVATSGDFGIRIYDLAMNKCVLSIARPRNLPPFVQQRLAFSSDGKSIVSGSRDCVQAWETDTGQMLQQLPIASLSSGALRKGAPLPLTGGRVTIAGGGGPLGVYTLADGKPIWKHSDVRVSDMAATENPKRIYTCDIDYNVRVWDSSNGEQIHSFRSDGWTPGTSPPVSVSEPMIVCNGSGTVLAIKRAGTFSVWDFTRVRRQRELEAKAQKARELLQVNPNDGKALADLGEWYALRSVWPWAAELLEKARQQGAPIPSLTLARCYWQMDKLNEAAAEFLKAIDQKEGDAVYLNLCLNAVRNSANGLGTPTISQAIADGVAAAPATTRPASAKDILVGGITQTGPSEFQALTLDAKTTRLVPLFKRDSKLLSNPITHMVMGQHGLQYGASENSNEIVTIDEKGEERFYYKHNTWVRALALDPMGNLYFSEAAGGTIDGTIYRLVLRKGKGPTPEVFRKVLFDEMHGWVGDFTFGLTADGSLDVNTLYLSTGNSIPASIFRTTKKDNVWSVAKCIFTSDGTGIQGLVLTAPGEAYFVDRNIVCRILNWHNMEVVAKTDGKTPMWLTTAVVWPQAQK